VFRKTVQETRNGAQALDTLDKSLDEAMTVQQPFWQGIETQRRIVGLLVGSGARGILRISVFGRRRSCTT